MIAPSVQKLHAQQLRALSVQKLHAQQLRALSVQQKHVKDQVVFFLHYLVIGEIATTQNTPATSKKSVAAAMLKEVAAVLN